MGLALGDGKVTVETILPLEWEQATSHDLSFHQHIDFQRVKFIQSEPSYRLPRILSSSTLPLDESGTGASDEQSIPVGSFITASSHAGPEGPRVFRIVRRSCESGPRASKKDDEHTCVRLEHWRQLLDRQVNAVAKTEEIHLGEFINAHRSVGILIATGFHDMIQERRTECGPVWVVDR